jgi:hypothetical protein
MPCPPTIGEARAYPRPLPNLAWLAKLTEEILEPDLPIVDPHHNLWDHPASRYLLDELLADLSSGHNIVTTSAFYGLADVAGAACEVTAFRRPARLSSEPEIEV